MLLRVPLMIFSGLLTIEANVEQHITTEIGSENNNSSWLNVNISKESERISKKSDDDSNAYPLNTTTSVSKIIQIQVVSSESSHEKSPKKTIRNNSGVVFPTDSDLKQETESDKVVDDKSKEAYPLDSNVSFIVTAKRYDLEKDDIASTRRFDSLADSETKNLNLNDTNNFQYTTNTDMGLIDITNNESASGESLSDHNLEPNTEISQVYRSDTDHKPFANKEKHTETEFAISRDAGNHNTNTEASKESKIKDENDGTNEKDRTEHDVNIQGSVDHDNDRSNESKPSSSNITEIDGKELIGHKKIGHTVNALFTRRSLNYDDSENFNETNTTKTTDQPTTTEEENNSYDLVRRDGFTRRNLNYDNAVSKESEEENDYFFGLTRRNLNQGNKKNDFTVTMEDIIKPIETRIDSEELETALSRSGRPDGGYIAEPYTEYRKPNLMKSSQNADLISTVVNTICCPVISSPLNYRTIDSFIIYPTDGKIPLLFNPRNTLGKSMEINPNVFYNENEHGQHYQFPNIKILHLNENYENPEALNVFSNHANTISNPSTFAHHENKIPYPEKHAIVFANKKNPLTSYENPLANQEMPRNGNPLRSYDPLTSYGNSLENHGNNYAKLENRPVNYVNPYYVNYENPPVNYENPPINPHSNYKNPLKSYDLLTSYGNPLENHGNNNQNLPTNYGNPYANYENPFPRHDIFINHGNPPATYENNYQNHGKYPANQNDYDPPYNHYQRHDQYRTNDDEMNAYPRARDSSHQVKSENPATNHENQHSNYVNPLRRPDPLTKLENLPSNHENPLENLANSHTNNGNPLSKHENLRRLHDPLINHVNPSSSNGNNLAKLPEGVPFYNNFRHHESSLTGYEDIDDHFVNLYPRSTGTVNNNDHLTIPVPSYQASRNPNSHKKAVRQFPVKAVPFRMFFLSR